MDWKKDQDASVGWLECLCALVWWLALRSSEPSHSPEMVWGWWWQGLILLRGWRGVCPIDYILDSDKWAVFHTGFGLPWQQMKPPHGSICKYFGCVFFIVAGLNISAPPPLLRDWVIKGLGMYSCVYATWHIKDLVTLIEKRRGLSPGGRFPPSFIHQVFIITELNKLYNRMFSPWRWP